MFEQLSFDDVFGQSFKITKQIKLIELFAGVGSQAMALRDIGADFEHHKVVEFDKYAIASYNAIHGTDFPTIDITTVTGADLEITDPVNYCYLMTYSFPCTDLSVAGKMMGMAEGSGTRSSLLWEVKRLLEEVENLPQVLLMENVPQVHSKSNMPHFQRWLDFLDSKGYTSYWQDLNAKNYGVAQSRNRCFCVSILGDVTYKFPEPFSLNKVMRDYLEDEVDEKYYLKSEKARELIDKLVLDGKILGQTDRQTDRQSTCLLRNRESSQKQTVSRHDTMQELATSNRTDQASLSIQELGFIEKGTGQHQSNTVYGAEGVSPTLNAVNWREPIKIVEYQENQ